MSAQAPTPSVELLLPFFVNGTLDAEERAEVEAALRERPELERDVDMMRNLRREMQAEEDGFSPGEFGLARLMRDIDAEAAPAAPRRQGILAPMALAAAVAMVAVLGTQQYLIPSQEPVYEQASGDAGDVLDAAFTVTFRPDATEAEISALMQDLGLVIVDGPSSIGLYRLATLDGGDLAPVADALRDAAGVIERVDLVE